MLYALAQGLSPINLRTMALGAAAYVMAAGLCVFAWRNRASRYWMNQAIFQFLLAIETWARLRHRLTDIMVELLGWDFYGRRHYPQLIATALVGALFLVAAAVGGWRVRRAGRGAFGAFLGSAISLFLLAVSAISAHAVDAVLYRRVDPVFLMGWCWAGAAALVMIGAMAAVRSASPASEPARPRPPSA